VPEDKFAVLGLVTTKIPQLESSEFLAQRIGDAGRYTSMERLGLSPQCGFASSVIGNKLSAEDQQRKLDLVTKTAQLLWH
jgi:5-methyltetrahydropteroyltriglutamate--homocysteine methyltransferase